METLPPQYAPEHLPFLALPWKRVCDYLTLPMCAAIYFLIDPNGTILYIGKTTALKQRWQTHHRRSQAEAITESRIAYLVVEEPDLLGEIEKACIAYFQPPWNRHRIPFPYRPVKRAVPRNKLLILLTDEQMKAIQAIKKEDGIPMQEFVRRAINTALELYKRQRTTRADWNRL